MTAFSIGDFGLPAVAGEPLSEVVYRSMRDKVIQGIWQEGLLLPKEDDLAALYGVSRTVLREALARLRRDGLVESKRGTGSRVTCPRRDAPAASNGIAGIEKCFEFRVSLEPQIARLAAQRRGPEELTAIRLAKETMENDIAGDRFDESLEVEFHTAIARAAQNEYFVAAFASIAAQMQVAMSVANALSMHLPVVRRFALTMAEHDRIFAAIEAGDGDAAEVAMRNHVEAARRRVFQGMP